MISVICGVRNRTKSLVEVLPTWLDAEGVKEIVITDWNSEDPFIYNHEKVHIVRVRDVGYWSLTQALNIAARFAHENIYAKLDADYKILNPAFFTKEIPLRPGWFINGAGKRALLNGFFYLYRDDFWKVNGFDERMHGYGWDDTDLALRLKETGLKLHLFDAEGNIEHLPHEEQADKSMHGINARMANDDPWNSSMSSLGVRYLVKESPNRISCEIYPSIDFLYGV